MQEVIEENMRSRQEAAEQALEIIDLHTEEFMGWLRSLDAASLIQDYRRTAEKMRNEVLQRAMKLLHNGKSPEEALTFLAHSLTNKLLHTPSSQIRRAGFDGEKALLDAANTLFQIDGTGGRK